MRRDRPHELQMSSSARWRTTLLSKVNSPHAVDLRALCGAKLVKLRSFFETTKSAYSLVWISQSAGCARTLLRCLLFLLVLLLYYFRYRFCGVTLLIRNRHPLGSYGTPMPKALWWSWGGGAVAYDRVDPVEGPSTCSTSPVEGAPPRYVPVCFWSTNLVGLFTVYSLLSTLYSLLSTIYSPHSTLHSAVSTPHSLLSTLCSPLSTLHSLLSTLYSPLSTLHSPISTLNSLLSTLYPPLSIIHSLLPALYSPHCILHSVLSTLHSPLSAVAVLSRAEPCALP